MIDKNAEVEVRAEVAPPDPAWTGYFHSGAHPQRPLPSDLNDAEAAVIDRERRQLHADVPPAGEPADEEVLVMHRLPFINPARPAQGVLYMGASAAEELALATGRSPDEAERIVGAPRERREQLLAERRDARDARERDARDAAPPDEPPPPDQPAPDAPPAPAAPRAPGAPRVPGVPPVPRGTETGD